jgi:TetR/AcrR family transcriptional regulator, transcriptional repressor of aconitase
VITAVITFGRSASGGFVVRIPSTGAFTSGPPTANAPSTTSAPSQVAQYGYDGATVARLEKATGLSRGAIFHYFAGKKDLFVEVAVDVTRRYIGTITTGGIAEALHEIAKEDPELLAVLIETEFRLRRDEDFMQRMQATSQEELPALDAWLQEQRESGAFRTDIEWIHLAHFAIIVINGLALRIAAGDETDVETVVQLLDDALRPQA